MADIFDEILNDEKDKKRLQFFRKSLPIIITATIIIAFAIGWYSWFLQSKIRYNQEVSDPFVKIFFEQNNDKKLIMNLLKDLSLSDKSRMSELAAIKIVDLQTSLGDGDGKDVMEMLEAIINKEEYSEITKSYARILYVNSVLNLDELSTEQEERTIEYLQYFDQDSKLFYATATLLKSLFYLRNNRLDLAEQYAQEILKLSKDSEVIKKQAKAVLAQLFIKKSNIVE